VLAGAQKEAQSHDIAHLGSGSYRNSSEELAEDAS
jgi:hypothetical protein